LLDLTAFLDFAFDVASCSFPPNSSYGQEESANLAAHDHHVGVTRPLQAVLGLT
jgi:hypothetical protein